MSSPPPQQKKSHSHALDYAAEAVGLAAKVAPSIPVAGDAIGIALEGVQGLLNLVSTANSNKEELPALIQKLKSLCAMHMETAQVEPITQSYKVFQEFQSELQPFIVRCDKLREKSQKKRYLWLSPIFAKDLKHVKIKLHELAEEYMIKNSSILSATQERMEADVKMKYAMNMLANKYKVSARYNADNTPDVCLEGTRVEIIAQIIDHLTSLTHTHQFLLLSGSAGSGKSTIAKTVAEKLAKCSALAASFFFSSRFTGRSDSSSVPIALAYQLAQYNPQFQQLLSNFLEENKFQVLDENTANQFDKLVVQLLCKMDFPAGSPLWIICLDALDECGENHGETVVSWLSAARNKIPSQVRFFLTGRPEVPATIMTGPLRVAAFEMKLDDQDPTTVEADIQKYLDFKLPINSPKWHNKEKAASALLYIKQQSAGLFIYAATSVLYIDHKGSQKWDKEAEYLRGLKRGHKEINALYHGIVSAVAKPPYRADEREAVAYARQLHILYVVLNLVEPLDLESLSTLLEETKEDVHSTLMELSAVIHVPDLRDHMGLKNTRMEIYAVVQKEPRHMSLDKYFKY
ncbi:WD-REPEATS-REGION domain-containing protein [Mycena indigotica]|uniref:WD-REPEATS-REGION domain-containing protein n=1 Tax=Mycena indigotica TaxID=2126181 RepID=A0A8H6WF36_9AGAR|nr:WD-REPEATS-REGION domain-containing protein [Mycena indigotica]KAF7310119.1 WD-REPEATS-REGION domain-containing protein [Mycena indigotica]